ncbi:hypothetical protein [Streptomyces roseoverticillatus]|uniref:Uncharacterized protein n=1 Tax=Streptomyces roseoverticillatus TaxID=66429 RepID=A0ABV3IQX2_9ACTN
MVIDDDLRAALTDTAQRPLGGPLRAGTRRVPAAELHGLADAAVDTVLRAYGSD